jgi:hypothetical protein
MFGRPEDQGLINPKDVKKYSKAVTDLENSILNTDQIIHIEEVGNVENQLAEMSPIASYVMGRFERARDNRSWDEERWEIVYRNYRGIYGPDVAFLDTEKSRAFIKVTKTKVLAAYAQILDVLFSGNKFPIGVEATPVPLGIEEAVHIDKNKEPVVEDQGPKTRDTRHKELQLGPDLSEKFEQNEQVTAGISIGEGSTPTAYSWHPAERAAKLMEKEIHDQLDEANASKSLRSTIFECALFGTGIFKGPFTTTKEYPKWNSDGEYEPVEKIIPDVEHVSIWDAYPDPEARSMEECEYFIQRHRMSKHDLRQLKNRPYFRDESINLAIAAGPNYQMEDWESVLNDRSDVSDNTRFEVIEYWGLLDSEMADESELDIPEEYSDLDEVQVNIWVCNDQVIRLVMNPFKPMRIPFYAVPYEHNPYSLFGVGVAENMIDTQQIMNGFLRLSVDNAALSGNIIFEIDESNLSPGQDMKLYPGKVFVRQGGAPGQSFFSHKVQNVTQECLAMFDKARQLADEATGMPSYAHGGVGIQGVGKTASGMSMLMGAAALNIKAVVKNVDDYLLTPLGESMYAFNMQFNFDQKYIGDLAISAKGTESLMRNEVRSQKLMQFMQLSANPQFAPFIKMHYLLSEIASSLDLEAERVVNDPREAALQAQTMGMANAAQAGPQADGGVPQDPRSQGIPQPGGTGNQTPGPGTSPAAEGVAQTPGSGSFQGNPESSGPQTG